MIVIPKSFKEVMVKDYIALRPILDKEYDNPLTRTIDLLSVFNDSEEVRKLKPRDLPKLDFMFEEPSRKLEQYFEIKGRDYGIVNHVEDLEAGQYISVVSLLKNLSEDPNLYIDKLHEILSCVIFPVDEHKNVKSIEPSYFRDLAKDIYETMSIDEAYPIGVFFCNLSRILMSSIKDSLNQKFEGMTMEAQVLMLEATKDILKDGDGLLPSTISAMETLQNDLTTKK